MCWTLDFISKDNFKQHVRLTIERYGDKLTPYDLGKFNSNLIDPIKMIFDKAVYREDWETLISNEIFRQRDKSNNNEIGYFHQRVFDYLPHCHVPQNGTEGGWDVIVDMPDGYQLDNGNVVHTIYVEMKNKHNTMNSASSAKTYMKMQNQLLKNDDCACFLVEAIAKQSQNIAWKTKIDGMQVSHVRIRRVSLDRFYQIVTGDELAFYKMCQALPSAIKEVLAEEPEETSYLRKDIVFKQLSDNAKLIDETMSDKAFVMAVYLLGFETYLGFKDKPHINSLAISSLSN